MTEAPLAGEERVGDATWSTIPAVMRVGALFSARTLNDPLGRRGYVSAGLALMAFKYAVDATLIYQVTGVPWTPVDYLFPLMSFVGVKVSQFPAWLNAALLAWTAPFVWIGVTLSVRRAYSAAVSPWWVVAFFLPVLNYVFMSVLALLPERVAAASGAAPVPVARLSRRMSMVAGAAAGAATGLAIVALGVLVLGTYGLSLFLAMPFLVGAVAGFVSIRLHPLPVTMTVSAGVTAAAVLGVMLLAVALEGLVCILMAVPLAIPLVVLGAVIGHRLGEPDAVQTGGLALMLLLLPAGSALDRVLDRPAERVVLTSLEIAAPARTVWPHVIAFDEIDGPPPWYFRFGLAYPLRARIVGTGVGAVRYCEFTTGAFREPITAWEAPSRLAFDVTEEPPPLREWSPYARVVAPHQQRYFRTSRGEFRLIELPDGRTRLEGRTWYSLRIYPAVYWTVIAERIIHDIHQRVLRHIARRAEAGSATLPSGR